MASELPCVCVCKGPHSSSRCVAGQKDSTAQQQTKAVEKNHSILMVRCPQSQRHMDGEHSRAGGLGVNQPHPAEMHAASVRGWKLTDPKGQNSQSSQDGFRLSPWLGQVDNHPSLAQSSLDSCPCHKCACWGRICTGLPSLIGQLWPGGVFNKTSHWTTKVASLVCLECCSLESRSMSFSAVLLPA